MMMTIIWRAFCRRIDQMLYKRRKKPVQVIYTHEDWERKERINTMAGGKTGDSLCNARHNGTFFSVSFRFALEDSRNRRLS